MWNRACPLCFTKVPRNLVLTRGEELVCPSCRTALELSRASRVLAAATGLIAGFMAAYVVLESLTGGRWAFPMVAALLAYGIVSAIVLFLLSDLVVQPKSPMGHFPHAHK
jgi:hypothetical protein